MKLLSLLIMMAGLATLNGCKKEVDNDFTRAGDNTSWALVAGKYNTLSDCYTVLAKIQSYPSKIRFSGSMAFVCRGSDAGSELMFQGSGFGATIGTDKQFNDLDLHFHFDPSVANSKTQAYLNCQEIVGLLKLQSKYLENEAIIEGPMVGACTTADEVNNYRLSIAAWRTAI